MFEGYINIYCFSSSSNMSCTFCFGPNGKQQHAIPHEDSKCLRCIHCFGPDGKQPHARYHEDAQCNRCTKCFNHVLGVVKCAGLFPEASHHTFAKCIHQGKAYAMKHCQTCQKETEHYFECMDGYQEMMVCHNCL